MKNYNSQESHPQVRLRNRMLAAAILLLAVVNGVAGYFDLHDSVTIFILNLVGVAIFVAGVVVEFRRMIPRKRWRALSFLMPSLGVIMLFCGRVVDSEGYSVYDCTRNDIIESNGTAENASRQVSEGKAFVQTIHQDIRRR